MSNTTKLSYKMKPQNNDILGISIHKINTLNSISILLNVK